MAQALLTANLDHAALRAALWLAVQERLPAASEREQVHEFYRLLRAGHALVAAKPAQE